MLVDVRDGFFCGFREFRVCLEILFECLRVIGQKNHSSGSRVARIALSPLEHQFQRMRGFDGIDQNAVAAVKQAQRDGFSGLFSYFL